MSGQTATSAQEAVAESATFRSMQRRLEAQRQTIRWLAIALLALAAITIIFWTAVFFSQQSAAPEMASTTTAPAATGPGSNTAVNGTPSAQATASNQDALVPPSVDVVSNQDYIRAQELISEARNVDRRRNERIADYREALRLLKAVERQIPAGQAPKELVDLIQQSNRELEQLQLEEFFP